MRLVSVVLAWCVTGCTVGSPASPAPSSTVVTVSVLGVPSLVAVRDGDGAWTDVVANVYGDYAFEVHDLYLVAIVCSDASGFDTIVRAQTPGDGDPDLLYCNGHALVPANAVDLTGHMLQSGSVSAGDSQTSTTAPWDFRLGVAPGSHDVVALGNGKIEIERGVAVTGATALAPIDVDASGTPLVAVPLTVADVHADDTVTTEVDLYTASDFHFGPAIAGTTAEAPDASLLVDSDSVDFYVDVTTATTERTADTYYTGSETTLPLMPVLSGITYTTANGSLQAHWGSLPPYTALGLAVSQGASMQEYTATKAYLDATGAALLDLAFDPPPDFRPEWKVNLAQPYARAFTATNDATDVTLTTSTSESVTP